jgi:hypothetical protein
MKEPTLRGRFLRRQGYGGRVEGQSTLAKASARHAVVRSSGPIYVFLRNEPTVLEDEVSCIIRIIRCLWRLQARFAGGFVLENEPTGGVFLGRFHRKVGSFSENEATFHLR